MAVILLLETSTAVCSAALIRGEEVLFEKASFEGPSHAALLGIYVEEAFMLLRENGLTLDAVAISGGPGSYTGLRIGTSMAKGLCFGQDIPLISIWTLEVMASSVASQEKGYDFYIPLMDARRMEVYDAVYDPALKLLRPVTADVIDETSFAEYLEKGRVCFFGNGAEKCKPVIRHANASFIDGIYPLAINMAPLANDAFAASRFENVAYYEPFYLKEFVAIKAKNKVLNR